MEQDLEEKEVEKLKEVFSKPLEYKKEEVSSAALLLNYVMELN